MKRKSIVIFLLVCVAFVTGCANAAEKENVIENVPNPIVEEVKINNQVTETTKEVVTETTKRTTETQITTTNTTTKESSATATTAVQTTTATVTSTSTTTCSTTTGNSTNAITITELQVQTTINNIVVTTQTIVSPSVVPDNQPSNIKDSPKAVQQFVDHCKETYPGIHIGCGLFSLDGKQGYIYNGDEEIYSACTIKAPYAMYVLKECEKQGLNLWTTTIKYTIDMYNGGSGILKDGPVDTEYSIGYLLSLMLKISDNTAYNVLVSRFGLQGYQQFLNQIGGQNLYGSQYGRASVRQRLNEWVEIVKYINSGSTYAQVLQADLTGSRKWNPETGTMQVDPNGSQYCYLVESMKNDHEYMHKSGWSYGDYTSAADCAVIDNKYLAIIITADYSTGQAHADVVKQFGWAVETYVNKVGIDNIFK